MSKRGGLCQNMLGATELNAPSWVPGSINAISLQTLKFSKFGLTFMVWSRLIGGAWQNIRRTRHERQWKKGGQKQSRAERSRADCKVKAKVSRH
jgi:hypothetical protein